jgi:hypothetical protein
MPACGLHNGTWPMLAHPSECVPCAGLHAVCVVQVRIWDVALMVKPSAAPQRHTAEVTNLAIASCGSFVATASKDNATGVWALPRLKPSADPDAAGPKPPEQVWPVCHLVVD